MESGTGNEWWRIANEWQRIGDGSVVDAFVMWNLNQAHWVDETAQNNRKIHVANLMWQHIWDVCVLFAWMCFFVDRSLAMHDGAHALPCDFCARIRTLHICKRASSHANQRKHSQYSEITNCAESSAHTHKRIIFCNTLLVSGSAGMTLARANDVRLCGSETTAPA